MKLANRVFAILSFSAFTLVVGACGGGGSGGSAATPTAVPPVATGTGTIVVLIGDDDISDWDQAIFAISRVLLLGGADGQVIILDEMRMIDLLALETVNEILAASVVPADIYTKIRFEVDSITLVKLNDPEDPEMGILEQVEVQQSSHKVDVVPQGPFTIGEGQNIVLEIDVDIENSIKAHETGNGTWMFRPVIFAIVLTVDEPGGLVRVFGHDVQLAEIDALSLSAFDLCDLVSGAEINPLLDPDDCIKVTLHEETSVFEIVMMDGDEVLQQVSSDDIGDDHSAVIYGFVDLEADDFTISAEIVALGIQDTYTIVECEAEGPVEGDPPNFPCEVEDTDDDVVTQLEADDDTVITIALIEGSKLFNRDGEPAELAAIMDDFDIEGEGHFVEFDEEGVLDRLDAFIVFVDDDPEDEVEGTLSAIDLANRTLTVIDEDDGVTEHCVAYDDDTMFFKVDEGAEVDVVESGVVTAAELEEGIEVEASGIFEDDCLQASKIILEVADDDDA